MTDAIRAALSVESRSEGKRFMCAWLEEAPSLTEDQIASNVQIGTAMAFMEMYPDDPDRGHREWHQQLSLLLEGGIKCDREEAHNERDEMQDLP